MDTTATTVTPGDTTPTQTIPVQHNHQNTPETPHTNQNPEQPTHADSLHLVALPTAIVCSTLFVASRLNHWHLTWLQDDAQTIAAELVTLAVNDTGPDDPTNWHALNQLNPITVRLLRYAKTIRIEVWDTATEHEAQDEHHGEDEAAEHGHDHEHQHEHGDQHKSQHQHFVATTAERWGATPTAQGRVLWAELSTRLPTRTPGSHSVPFTSPPADEGRYYEPEFLRRVRDGLARL